VDGRAATNSGRTDSGVALHSAAVETNRIEVNRFEWNAEAGVVYISSASSQVLVNEVPEGLFLQAQGRSPTRKGTDDQRGKQTSYHL
jgi:hypothetical protein